MCRAPFLGLAGNTELTSFLGTQNPDNTSCPFPWGWSCTGDKESRGRPRWPRVVAEKPLESKPGTWPKVLAQRLIRSLGNVTECLLSSAFSSVKRRDCNEISESPFSSNGNLVSSCKNLNSSEILPVRSRQVIYYLSGAQLFLLCIYEMGTEAPACVVMGTKTSRSQSSVCRKELNPRKTFTSFPQRGRWVIELKSISLPKVRHALVKIKGS